MLQTALGRLRLLAFIEGISFLVLLFITMPLKYLADWPEPNKFFGIIHGILFVFYCLLVLQMKIEENWSIKKLLLALLASVIPFGTFWADKRLFTKD